MTEAAYNPSPASALKWTGEFIDPALEAAYKEQTWPVASRRLGWCCLFGGLAFAASSLIDYLDMGLSLGFWICLGGRLASLLLGLLAFHLSRGEKYRPSVDFACLAFALVVGATLITIVAAKPYHAQTMPLTTMIVTLVFYSFAPIRLTLSIFAMLLASTGVATALGVASPLDPARLISVIFLLAVTNFMGIHFARYLNIGGRREFFLLRQARQLARQYRQVVENATQAIFVIQHHRMPLANPMTQKITGYSAEELAEMAFADLAAPDDRERLLQRFSAILDGDKPRGVTTFRIRDKQGRLKWIEAAGVIIEWEGEPALLAFANDITQRKQAEKEKEESAKMQGVLEMAGAACHEINQPLQVISAVLELMSLQEPQAPKTIEHIKTMSIQINRLVHITRSIQGITRYKTRDYLGETKIVDIQKSSADPRAQDE